jgi:hypothetical protein
MTSMRAYLFATLRFAYYRAARMVAQAHGRVLDWRLRRAVRERQKVEARLEALTAGRDNNTAR